MRRLRPFARLAASTFRPLAVDIRFLKPCLFLFLRTEGWNVLFIAQSYFAGSVHGIRAAYTSPMCQSYRGKGRHFFPIHYHHTQLPYQKRPVTSTQPTKPPKAQGRHAMEGRRITQRESSYIRGAGQLATQTMPPARGIGEREHDVL